MVLVFLAGAATRGSQRWIDLGFFQFQPSEFGKLLFVLVLAGVPRRAGRSGSASRARCSAAIGLAASRSLLVFLQPDIGTALVYGAALAAVLFVAGTRWLHLAALGARSSRGRARPALAAARRGRPRAQAVPGDRLTGFTTRQRPERRRPTTRTSRSPRSARAGSTGAASRARRRRTSTTSPSTRPTSCSPRSPSSAASSARRSCSCSTCSSSGAGCASSRSRATRSRRSSPAASSSRSSSRSSSTSG